MALNRVGDILATASERGTIIRLWKLSQEKAFNISLLRRGTDKAELNDLQFSKNSNYLAAASDHQTIHVFKVDPKATDENAQEANNLAEEE